VRALFTFGAEVPTARALTEHRRWLVPLGLVLAVNLAVLTLVVLPLRQAVQSGASRAQASGQSLREAMADLKDAEATRDGQAQASADLDRFYASVLPVDMPTARRMTHLKLSQLARSHDVIFQGGGASTEALKDSTLERLKVNYALTGDWDDIRQMIYEIETGPDFVVIDNMRLVEGAETNAPLSLTLELSTYYRVAGPNVR
jgi:Type II secretion system (T2SS), protein M subtype b